MGNLHIYLLAGVQTKDSAFYTMTKRLNEMLAVQNKEANIELLYPYGDYTRKLWKQVLDLCVDINFISRHGGIGGGRVRQRLSQALNEEKSKYLFIGHSGGGIAAYRIARYLFYKRQISLEQIKIVQVGSPKIRIAKPFKPHIAYIQAVNEAGKPKDPITKIGYWGGGPSHIYNIPLIGGHADYFRTHPPFIDIDKRSNLDHTFHYIENWLKDWI